VSSPKKPTQPEGTPPEPPFEPWILPGTPYRILAKLAEGGMGQVLDAEHIGLRKRVVVKLLHETLEGRRDLLDRMRVEAQALALLSHPNIVQVTDFGTTSDGKTFLVMERLIGKTLGKEISERRPLPVAEAIAIIQQVLAGLAAAHAAGIIHRDIKLENVFLCDGAGGPRYVKLLDFGLVKLLPEDAARPRTTPAVEPLQFPTNIAAWVGTPAFLSPEQAERRPVDARSDIYAVGLLLYILVTGKAPFDHIKSFNGMLDAHATLPPEHPSKIAPQPIPEALDRAIMKALAKQPADRFATAAAFSAELAKIAAALAVDAALVRTRWDTTEPIKPMDRAFLAALPERPSDPLGLAFQTTPVAPAPLGLAFQTTPPAPAPLGLAFQTTPPAPPPLASPSAPPPLASPPAPPAPPAFELPPLPPPTERIPALASIIDAERRAAGSHALASTAPLPHPNPSTSTALRARAAETTQSLSDTAAQPIAALPTTPTTPTTEELQQKARFAFLLSFLASVLLFGALTAVLLLTLLR
jgi:serine/threonine-protein kinase